MNNTMKITEFIPFLESLKSDLSNPEVKSDIGRKVLGTMNGAKNFDIFGGIREKLEKANINRPIVAVADINPRQNPEEKEFYIDILESGNLAECFDGDADLSQYYISNSGDLCYCLVSRHSKDFFFYRALKKNVPTALAQRIFSQICDKKLDMSALYQLTNSIGYEVLDALGLANTAYGDANGC